MYTYAFFARQDTHATGTDKQGTYSVDVGEDDSLLEELEPITGSPSTTSAPPHFVIARKLWHPMQQDTADLQGVHLE